MKKNIFNTVTKLALGITITFSAVPMTALAEESVEAQLKTTKEAVVDLIDDIKELETAIDKKDDEISATTDEIKKLEKDIETNKEEIKEKEKAIADLEEKYEERASVLKDRVVAMQQQDRTSIIVDMVVNASNILDFIQKMDTISTLFASDTETMEQLEKDQKKLEEERIALEKKEEVLKADEATLVEKQDTLKSQKDKLKEKKDKLSASKEEKTKSVDHLAKQLEEAKQKLDASSAVVKETENVLVANGEPGKFYGVFQSPIKGNYRITSPFGYRIHPISGQKKFHKGIDMVTGNSNEPIYAAAGGTIVFAGFDSSGYGNYIVIQHDADTFSAYAHNSKNMVQVGQKVAAGEQIAVIGTTGSSTGIHLHFEIMENTSSRWDGHVDPAPRI